MARTRERAARESFVPLVNVPAPLFVPGWAVSEVSLLRLLLPPEPAKGSSPRYRLCNESDIAAITSPNRGNAVSRRLSSEWVAPGSGTSPLGPGRLPGVAIAWCYPEARADHLRRNA
ncbi:hypothetical protein GCM10017790_21320 [Amycolatopsis oliviviridis]|uniref:Uncharacterized protein n=1 Tax=Amycolatopsis oliviviridis TaxID=1471590 RepID=A0ABQ3LBK0_9PSEU|nr:hypothetical protein GCM10017790_21320 [Amycolatopsis oliviviridis]